MAAVLVGGFSGMIAALLVWIQSGDVVLTLIAYSLTGSLSLLITSMFMVFALPHLSKVNEGARAPMLDPHAQPQGQPHGQARFF